MERATRKGSDCENAIARFCIPLLSLDQAYHSVVELRQFTWYFLQDTQYDPWADLSNLIKNKGYSEKSTIGLFAELMADLVLQCIVVS